MPMLHKSFKPAKCKTALKMASSRIKLLRNKRDVQLRQLKKEVAQLLAAGHDRTARIRVEHVVNEEKTVAAYDLLEIYCELIVARLNMIESQKICPIDLKEAISSVIFATPRCADLPELVDVKKNFTAKYGKDFISAAIELRPNSGVSRLLVEKLSAKAPNGPEKMKILSAIAVEHNVKWDPESFEDDIKPPEDLLNGPGTFPQGNTVPAQTQNVGPHTNFNQNQAFSHGRHDVSMSSYVTNSYSSSHLQPHSANDFGASSHPDRRTSGTRPEADYRHSHDRPANDFNSGSQQWNMGFKDATAAAQAAAESAERASMAARAAAELSSRDNISRLHSRESHFASGSSSRNEEHHAGSRLHSEEHSKDSSKTTFYSNSQVITEQPDVEEDDDLAALTERFYNLKSRLPTSESSGPHEVVSPSLSSLPTREKRSRRNSSESERSDISSDTSMERQPSDHEVHIGSNIHGGMEPGTVDSSKESTAQEQPSSLLPHSHSRISDDENLTSNWDHHESNEDTMADPFVLSRERVKANAQETSSYDIATAAFDDYGSDDDAYDSHIEDEVKDQRSNLFLSSESEVTSHPATDTVASHPDDIEPVTFDDSDGPSSENEEDASKLQVGDSTISSISSHTDSRNLEQSRNESYSWRESVPAANESVRYDGKSFLRPSFDDFDGGQLHDNINQGVEADMKAGMPFGTAYSNFHPDRPSIRSAESPSQSSDVSKNLLTPGGPSTEDNDRSRWARGSTEENNSDKESDIGSGKELNFGILAGGFRNKGYKHPPYRSNVVGSSQSKQSLEDNSTGMEHFGSLRGDISSIADGQETSSKALNPDVGKRTSSRTRVGKYNTGDGDSVGEPFQQKFGSNEESHNWDSGIEANKVSAGTKTFFDSDDSDIGEEVPTQKSAGKTVPAQVFSRRTKAAAAASNANRSSSAKTRTSSQPSGNVNRGDAPKSSLKSSGSVEVGRSTEEPDSNRVRAPERKSSTYGSADTQQSHPSQPKVSSSQANSRNRGSTVETTLRPAPEYGGSSSKDSIRSSSGGSRQASNPVAPKTALAGSKEESVKVSGSAGETPSRQESINRASHVHPKLPDYDTFAAHLLSLRQNRQ